MLGQTLNTEEVLKAMRDRGLNQASIAAQLDVSRQAVSRWIKGGAFPRPRVLLAISRILDLDFDKLVIEDESVRPVVAFRKHGRSILTSEHSDRAIGMGYMLRNLVDYLPYDTLSKPSSLISPQLDHGYIVKAAAEVRKKMQLTNEVVDFTDLIQFFDDLHAILIPVLWGKKNQHENAIHIYLPDSQTTWIYLNLDTHVVDFKFWMAHELGHVKAPELNVEEAEDFADAFAAELLLPTAIAEREYETTAQLIDVGKIVNKIKSCALRYMVSPVTVNKQLNTVAQRWGRGDLGINIFPAAGNFSKQFNTVSEALFSSNKPTASNYVRISSRAFGTQFFDVLRQFILDKHKGSGFIQKTLNISAIDSKQLYNVLVSDAQ
jgi:transcriptional regulator with XRE-family HTH domain